MVSGHLFLLHKISTLYNAKILYDAHLPLLTHSISIFSIQNIENMFYSSCLESLRLVLSNFFPMCFLALALETGKQLMQAWCHWNKAEVMNEHLEHLGTSQKILGRHRTSENV